MIARITGVLESIENGAALIRLGTAEAGLTYHVLLPAFAAARLGGALGQVVSLRTLHFIESQGQGTTMVPRLAGFLSDQDRRFYELFTTCKGIGPRKALRAMSLESSQIAAAIADRDVALLQSLPEVGRRTADTIVATLSGKVDAFLTVGGAGAGTTGVAGAGSPMAGGSLAREALEVLTQLGENRAQALTWIDQAMRGEERPGDVQALVQRVYQIKAGG